MLAMLAAFPRPAAAEPQICAAPWQRGRENLHELTRLRTLGLVAGSALPAVLLGPTGGDYEARRFVQTELGGSYSPEPVTIAAPYVALPATLVFWGAAVGLGACRLQKAPVAMLQGAIWTISTVALSKWVIGRTWPTGGRNPYAPDRLSYPEDAREYSPFAAGLAAFPSGHTATMFSLAAALRESSPELGTFRYLGYPVAVLVGLGMWWGDHHWASDVLSGALLGEALGSSAGRAWEPRPSGEFSYVLTPLPGGAGLGMVGAF